MRVRERPGRLDPGAKESGHIARRPSVAGPALRAKTQYWGAERASQPEGKRCGARSTCQDQIIRRLVGPTRGTYPMSLRWSMSVKVDCLCSLLDYKALHGALFLSCPLHSAQRR